MTLTECVLNWIDAKKHKASLLCSQLGRAQAGLNCTDFRLKCGFPRLSKKVKNQEKCLESGACQARGPSANSVLNFQFCLCQGWREDTKDKTEGPCPCLWCLEECCLVNEEGNGFGTLIHTPAGNCTFRGKRFS